MDLSTQELNITELRRQKRPLWMSDLGIDDYSDIVGGGGDIWNDRLPPAWPRHEGLELSQDDERQLGPVDIKQYEEVGSYQQQQFAQEQQFQEQKSGQGLGAQAEADVEVSGLADTVKKTAETATETISGVVGSLKNIFKGEEKEKE